MADVFDYAKYFIKRNLDNNRNTFDGNMKLQKLLVFANLISLAERDAPLFDDEVLAFQHGCVVEKVRLRYKNDFEYFVREAYEFAPAFTQEEYDILNLDIAIFGSLSAKELSDANHTFDFWKTAYQNSAGYKSKSKSVVTVVAMRGDVGKMRDVIAAFRKSQNDNQARETINGIDFYYTPSDFTLTDDVIDELYEFSLLADEQSYSVYADGEGIVIC